MFNNNGMQAMQQEMMQKIQSDPIGMGKEKGYQIPDNLAGDPKGIVMHLIQTGQIGGPMMQRIMPMIQKLNGR